MPVVALIIEHDSWLQSRLYDEERPVDSISLLHGEEHTSISCCKWKEDSEAECNESEIFFEYAQSISDDIARRESCRYEWMDVLDRILSSPVSIGSNCEFRLCNSRRCDSLRWHSSRWKRRRRSRRTSAVTKRNAMKVEWRKREWAAEDQLIDRWTGDEDEQEEKCREINRRNSKSGCSADSRRCNNLSTSMHLNVSDGEDLLSMDLDGSVKEILSLFLAQNQRRGRRMNKVAETVILSFFFTSFHPQDDYE